MQPDSYNGLMRASPAIKDFMAFRYSIDRPLWPIFHHTTASNKVDFLWACATHDSTSLIYADSMFLLNTERHPNPRSYSENSVVIF